jgi:hypothetical protein
MINPSVDAAAAAAAAAAAMITPGPVLSDKWVSASLAINAAVWDACAIVLFHRLYTAWGLVAVLVSGSFQCLALSTMQPHALAAINGISVVLALTLQRTTAKRLNRMQKLAVIFMISAAAVGLSGIRDAPRERSPEFTTTLVTLCLLAAVVLVKPVHLAVTKGVDALRQRPEKYLVPIADALIGTAATTCVATLSTTTHLWALGELLIIGVAGVMTARFSLGVNTVKDHVTISYSLWSVGLLSVDLAGRYECDPRLVAIQFFFVAISVTILVVK